MSDLQDLYQEVILDHNRSPRNNRRIDEPTHQADGHNPLCGDVLRVYLTVDEDGTVTDAAFEGQGCAISTASASLMTAAVKGRPREEAERLFDAFHVMATGDDDEAAAAAADLGKLKVFAGVREYPVRVKCATLCWHTLHAALAGAEQPATTE